MVSVYAPVVGGWRVGENFIKRHVIMIDVVANDTDLAGAIRAKIADESTQSDVNNVIPKAAAIGPTSRNHSVIHVRLERADQCVTTKEA